MKNQSKIISLIVVIGIIILFNSCTSIPQKAKPVENFEVNRYLGTWYEVARIDFRFEKDLDNTSANYTLDKKGNVIVLNSGYNFVKNKWSKADGLAKF